jgi:SAND domain
MQGRSELAHAFFLGGGGGGVLPQSLSMAVAQACSPPVRAPARLTGVLLGGHDRDLFIQCTGPDFANRPLVDVSFGGSILTCSAFEKAAGRELSKKWKESIHVAGEGEVSSAAGALGVLRTAAACPLQFQAQRHVCGVNFRRRFVVRWLPG